ncbi:transcriptional regulator [Gordonia zhaorongruii]|uniref:transcriptional regulator n=1 Tax=Gordonia zhaorongruii TaxID=2597659 RepID=UPI0039A36AED
MTDAASSSKRHRPALIVLTVVAAGACLLLAWWQWGRFESTSGSFQNLGYALQWPAFAIAVVYAYRRFVVMESDPDAAAERATGQGPTEIPDGILPERPGAADPSVAIRDDQPDETLTEYNRYLTELNDQREQPR